MTHTYIIKAEIENEDALYEALETLVETHGASFYTLVRDGEPLKVAFHDPHLTWEQKQAEVIANALYNMTEEE